MPVKRSPPDKKAPAKGILAAKPASPKAGRAQTFSEVPVYFADFRARAAKESKCRKIEKVFAAAGLQHTVQKGDLTAIKVHFGERGNDTFINPVFVRTVVDLLKAAGAKPFITDTNTLYAGSRHDAVEHLHTALEHGFGFATVGAPLVIADGLRGGSFGKVDIQQKHFASVKIADAILEARSMLVLSHFKGHEMAGFGGAIKNLAMGCSPSQGKCEQHASRFVVEGKKCIACGLCMANCPEKTITFTNAGQVVAKNISGKKLGIEDSNKKSVEKKGASGKKIAVIDTAKCVGCGECLTVCKPKAVGINWASEMVPFNERMVEYALGAVKTKSGRVGYINFLMNITPDCDCVPWSDTPLVPDIGILASTDPVALDAACFHLVNGQQGFAHSHLQSNHAPGKDKFKGTWSYTTGEVQLSYAESIGLGSSRYRLVTV